MKKEIMNNICEWKKSVFFPKNYDVWITIKEQMNNKRNNHLIKIEGEMLTISQISEKYNVPRSTVRWRDDNNRNVITGARMDGGKQE